MVDVLASQPCPAGDGGAEEAAAAGAAVGERRPGAAAAAGHPGVHDGLMLQLAEMQECLDAGGKDMKKLFRRMQQLEARQMELVRAAEAKWEQELRQESHRLDEAVALLGSRASSSEGRLAEQHRRLEEVATGARQDHRDLGRALQASLEDRISSLGSSQSAEQRGHAGAAERSLQQAVRSLEARLEGRLADQKDAMHDKLQQSQAYLSKRMDDLCVKIKELPRAQPEQAARAEKTACVHPAELERVSTEAMERYRDLASQLPPLCQRVAAVEGASAACAASLGSVEARVASAGGSVELRLRAATEGFDSASSQLREFAAQLARKLEDFEKRQDERDDHVAKALGAARSIEGKVKTFDVVDKRMGELIRNTEALLVPQTAGTTKCLFCGPVGAAAEAGSTAVQPAAKDTAAAGGERDRGSKMHVDNGEFGTASWRESILESIRKQSGPGGALPLPAPKCSSGHSSSQVARIGETTGTGKGPPAGAALAACRAVSSEARNSNARNMLPSKRPKSARSREG